MIGGPPGHLRHKLHTNARTCLHCRSLIVNRPRANSKLVTADRSALVVAQGNAGALWRFDLSTTAATEVATSGAVLTDADGLVRQGSRLTVVRNFARVLTTLRLTADGRSATLVSQQATDPTRVLTTAKVLRGRILFVDSKFDEPVATGPYEVVTSPLA